MNIQNLNFTVEELKILAENGQKDFIYAVGYYYENGIRTSVNLAESAVWYEKAVAQRVMQKLLCVLPFSMRRVQCGKNEKKLSLTWNRLQKPEIPMLSIM